MSDYDLQQISPTGKAPKTRIADVGSLNNVVKRIVEMDLISALQRQDIQAAVDGKSPYDQQYMEQSGQAGRANLNFGDLKRRVKREALGYYDLTDSVPVLAQVNSSKDVDLAKRTEWCDIMSEEFHKMLKDWAAFDPYHQLLVQKFTTHGLGFLYFEDDLNWKWRVAGLEDFKLPRQTNIVEEEVDIAVVFREVTVATLYHWSEMADDNDKRWNKQEVYKAILKAYNQQAVWSQGEWEKWETILKNNDIFASTKANEYVKLAHCWIREYSGKVSYYLTLRLGDNEDYLFKCENRFDNINQCFNFFPYEVGTNGTLHSVRGLAHERYPEAQVLNTVRNQAVDNARLAGSMVLQPKSATDAEDMAVIWYGGVVYIPPEVNVAQVRLQNPSDSMLPIINDMSMLLQDQTPNTKQGQQGDQRKTRFEKRVDVAEESVLGSAQLSLFYQPWKRHLNEVWRRVRNPNLKQSDPGGEEVWAFKQRCHTRGVPDDMLEDITSWVEPMRAVGFGSPANREATFDEFMQYYGSLDPVGQNNLLRDRFAQKVGYAQVDRYVPSVELNGRVPVDAEVAELQNAAMSMGIPVSVMPNDHHILHLQAHLPSLEADLTNLEQGQGKSNPQLLQVAIIKTQHAAQHMQLLKPDSLNEKVVAELTRKFNNLAERTSAADDRAKRDALKQQAEAATQRAQPPDMASPQAETEQQQTLRHKEETHQQTLKQKADLHQQAISQGAAKTQHGLAINDAQSAAKLHQNAAESQHGIALDKAEAAAKAAQQNTP